MCPCSATYSSSTSRMQPASHTSVPDTGSKLRTWFIEPRLSTTSSCTGTLPPTRPVLPPCGTTAILWVLHSCRMRDTSSVDLGRTTHFEWPVYLPIQSLLYTSSSDSSSVFHLAWSAWSVDSSDDFGVESTPANCSRISGVMRAKSVLRGGATLYMRGAPYARRSAYAAPALVRSARVHMVQTERGTDLSGLRCSCCATTARLGGSTRIAGTRGGVLARAARGRPIER